MTTGGHLATDAIIEQKFGIRRSPLWPEVAAAFRAAHPQCAACAEKQLLNIHHKFPFHYVIACGRPDLELDDRNLLTLCVRHDDEHHLLLGHLDDYESYNPQVLEFIITYVSQDERRIRDNAAWKQAAAAKPRHLDQMTPADKAAFKKLLDRKFPLLKTGLAEFQAFELDAENQS